MKKVTKINKQSKAKKAVKATTKKNVKATKTTVKVTKTPAKVATKATPKATTKTTVKATAKAVVTNRPTMIKVKTKTGKSFQISTSPIKGGRKVTSPKTKKVIYVGANVNRDQARVVFASYANVPYTGISARRVR